MSKEIGNVKIELLTDSGRHIKFIHLNLGEENWDANLEQLSNLVGRRVGKMEYGTPNLTREQHLAFWREEVAEGNTEKSFEDWLQGN